MEPGGQVLELRAVRAITLDRALVDPLLELDHVHDKFVASKTKSILVRVGFFLKGSNTASGGFLLGDVGVQSLLEAPKFLADDSRRLGGGLSGCGLLSHILGF